MNKNEPLSGKFRFLKSLVPAVVLMIAVFAVIIFIVTRLGSGIGLVLGIIAGGSFGFGVLLVYWNTVDWVNLRIIRKQLVEGRTGFHDGQLAAFSGTVRVDGAPMVSPFTQKECAAYTYTIAAPRENNSTSRRSRHVLAQGFHMLPTRIEGATGVLRLGALPSVEDDLRVNEYGEWTDLVREKLWKTYRFSSPQGRRYGARGGIAGGQAQGSG